VSRAPAAGQAAPLLDDPFRRFTLREKAALIAEITGSYVRVRWWLRRMTVEQAAAAARADPLGPVADPPPLDALRLAYRIGRLVERGLDRLPGDTRCLTRSLVLLRLLARRGIPATMVIGVRAAPAFGAHAWVEAGGYALLSPIEYESGRLLEI
jgi:hypothetical protein